MKEQKVMRNGILLVLVSMLLQSCGGIDGQGDQIYRLENFGSESASSVSPPKSGYVDKPEVAVAIAEAVAARFYGRREIENQRPYRVKRTTDRWVVQGRLSKGYAGGVFEIEVSSDGKILRLIHGE